MCSATVQRIQNLLHKLLTYALKYFTNDTVYLRSELSWLDWFLAICLIYGTIE